ncbi:MAG: YicC/YloC family endoribonuclease [Eubacteriales bacterium]
MINSMTGFGRSEFVENNGKVTIEIKSVNHRYLDINMKLPKKLHFFESQMRTFLKAYMQRGKVDVFVTYENVVEETSGIVYHSQLAKEYASHMAQLAKDCNLVNDLKATTLARFPEVFTMEETVLGEEELCAMVEKGLHMAAGAFVQTRQVEGERLKKDMLVKLGGMLERVTFIEAQMPQVVSDYKEKLLRKIRELLEDAQIEEARLMTEVTIFADKSCVDEEVVRLRSHIETTRETLVEGGVVGRKLDFIAQEMNREANTILSKAGSLAISNCAIELKTEIEKIREQIQNIE